MDKYMRICNSEENNLGDKFTIMLSPRKVPFTFEDGETVELFLTDIRGVAFFGLNTDRVVQIDYEAIDSWHNGESTSDNILTHQELITAFGESQISEIDEKLKAEVLLIFEKRFSEDVFRKVKSINQLVH